MNWSIKIAQVANIPIKVHITFFLILGLSAAQWAGRGDDPIFGGLFGIVLMLALFLCVTLHELGHSLMARFFGIDTREILLMPLGGVAQINKNPEKPLHEFLIAVAGPLVNVVIAAILLLIIGIHPNLSLANLLLDGSGLTRLTNDMSPTGLIYWLLTANVSLVLFNLIPAFPLDGGRMLRALLAMRLGMPRATRIASGIGQALAIGLGVYGFLSGNWLLALVAVFVFVGASQETTTAQAKTVLITRKVGDAYNKHAISLQNGDRISRVVDYLLTSYQPDFAVVFGNRLLGIVTREDVMRALAIQPNDCYVSEIMNRAVFKLNAADTLDDAREKMEAQNVRVAAVYDGEQFLGLLSQEDISEAFAILMFVKRHQQLRAISAQA
jgi:Zn-dependent protease